MNKKSRNQNIIIYVEGQTEKYFLQELGYLGRIERFNIWENDISKLVRTWKSNTLIYFVFDVDVIKTKADNHEKQKCIKRFHDNLKVIKTQKSVEISGLLQQDENFEDELIRSCSEIKNKQTLYKVFDAVGDDEFKNQFNKKNKLAEFLSSLGFDVALMWQQEFIQELKAHQNLQANHRHLIKKETT